MFWIAWPRARPGRPNTRGENLVLSSEHYIGRGGGLRQAQRSGILAAPPARGPLSGAPHRPLPPVLYWKVNLKSSSGTAEQVRLVSVTHSGRPGCTAVSQ